MAACAVVGQFVLDSRSTTAPKRNPPLPAVQNLVDVILRKFPNDPLLGLYAKPNIPPGKLGSALSAYTRLNPNDVIALHTYGNVFSGGSIAFTATEMHHPKGFVKYEDLRGATPNGKEIHIHVNQGGMTNSYILKTENERAAALLQNVLDAIITQPKADDLAAEAEALRDYEAEGFQHTEISWLKLRDEVMRTIDLLHERFQDGKLSLTEYENKRADLLARL